MGMMGFGTYTLFTMCIAISLFWFNMPTPLTYILGINSQGNIDPTGSQVYAGRPMEQTNFLQKIGQLFSTPTGIAALLAFTATTLAVSALTGFSSMYFVPVVLLIFITNFVSLPIADDVLNPTCVQAADPGACVAHMNAGDGLPTFLYYPILLIYNIMTVIACIAFVRGGV